MKELVSETCVGLIVVWVKKSGMRYLATLMTKRSDVGMSGTSYSTDRCGAGRAEYLSMIRFSVNSTKELARKHKNIEQRVRRSIR
jgi:hypothetical protein